MYQSNSKSLSLSFNNFNDKNDKNKKNKKNSNKKYDK
jgi:hypothetical protein